MAGGFAVALLATWGFGVVQGTLAVIFAVIFVILLLTAVTGFCPPCWLLDLSTCETQQSRT